MGELGTSFVVGAGGFDGTGIECAGGDESVFVSKDPSSAVSGGAGCDGVVSKSLVRSVLVWWSFVACSIRDSIFITIRLSWMSLCSISCSSLFVSSCVVRTSTTCSRRESIFIAIRLSCMPLCSGSCSSPFVSSCVVRTLISSSKDFIWVLK